MLLVWEYLYWFVHTLPLAAEHSVVYVVCAYFEQHTVSCSGLCTLLPPAADSYMYVVAELVILHVAPTPTVHAHV